MFANKYSRVADVIGATRVELPTSSANGVTLVYIITSEVKPGGPQNYIY